MSRACQRLIPLRICQLEVRTAPAAGLLDPTFGVGGLVTTRFPSPSDDFGQAVAVDSLGRIVVAGQSHNGSNIYGSNGDFAVARYTSAGALDLTFGETGVVTFA